MAEAQATASPNLHRPASGSMARARMVWAMRPLGFLLLLLWVLHPATADRLDYAHTALVGFLFGALYGLVIYGPLLKQYIVLHQPGGRLLSNRVPDEYYWGQVDNILYDNRK